MAEDLRTYSRAELEEVAQLGAGVGSGAVMRLAPDVVMPSEEIVQGLDAMLADFDERREGAAGFTAEQLFGTRHWPDLPDCGHGHVHPRRDGAKAKCGGPAICSECARDQAAVIAAAATRSGH